MLLRAGVKWPAMVTFCVAVLMTIASFVFLNMSQVFVINEVQSETVNSLWPVGSIIGNLSLADELTCLASSLLWGALSDKINSRRLIFASGFVVMAFGTFWYPRVSTVYPSSISSNINTMLWARMLYAIGAAAATDMFTALTADYAAEGARGRVGAAVGISSCLGGLLASSCLTKLTVWFGLSLRQVFLIVSLLQLMTGILCIIGLQDPDKNPNTLSQSDYLPNKETKPIDNGRLSLCRRIWLGISAAHHYPQVFIAYLSAFVARADTVVLTLFLGPWVAMVNGKNKNVPMSSIKTIHILDAEVKRRTGTLMAASHLAALLYAPVFGFVGDRLLGKVKSVILAALSGLIAFALVYFSDSNWLFNTPVSFWLILALTGVAQISMVISSTGLISALSPSNHRGALSGAFSFAGALGIIVASQVGGRLFDLVNPQTSFLTVVMSNAILLLLLGGIWLWMGRDENELCTPVNLSHILDRDGIETAGVSREKL